MANIIELVKKIKISRASYWIKILAKFASVQIVVQMLTSLGGILLIRTLSKEDYAYFTIANSMQSTMSLLADSGIGSSLAAVGGKVWQDNHRFSQLINTALWFRYRLAIVSVAIVTPILVWLLLHGGASPLYTLGIVATVLASLNAQLTISVLMVVLQMHSQIEKIQKFDLFAAGSRLLLLCISYFVFLNAMVATAIISVVFGIQQFILKAWTDKILDRKANINSDDQEFIFSTIKNVAPSVAFFCVQGQLGILLISLFGSTENIAEVGALSRLSILFSVVGSLMSAIVLPAFSRCQSEILLRRRYFQIVGSYVGLGFILVVFAALFPTEIVWILGKQYIHLKAEVLLMMISTVFSATIGIMSTMNYAKAWVNYGWAEIPLRIILQTSLLLILDISTVRGVLLFGLLSNISPFLVNMILTYQGLKTYRFSS